MSGNSPPRELLHRWIRVLAELDLRDRHQTGERHADRSTNDAFLGEARIEHARLAELLLQAERGRVHPTFASDILTEHHESAIGGKLALERTADRRQHVDA